MMLIAETLFVKYFPEKGWVADSQDAADEGVKRIHDLAEEASKLCVSYQETEAGVQYIFTDSSVLGFQQRSAGDGVAIVLGKLSAPDASGIEVPEDSDVHAEHKTPQ